MGKRKEKQTKERVLRIDTCKKFADFFKFLEEF